LQSRIDPRVSQRRRIILRGHEPASLARMRPQGRAYRAACRHGCERQTDPSPFHREI